MARAKVAPLLCERAAVCITGASRGFGRSVALAVVDAAARAGRARALHFVLCASHDGPALSAARAALLDAAAAAAAAAVSVDVVAFPFGAGHAAGEDALRAALRSDPWRAAEQHLLFNNAGVLGNVTGAADLRFDDYAHALLVNAAGHGAVAGAFLSATDDLHHCQARYVVHTASKAGKVPVKRWASYCASKAASDLLHRTIAAEYEHTLEEAGPLPPTKVLQYSPGPLKTDMTRAQWSKGVPPIVAPEWIDPSDSASRMIQLLLSDNYSTGESIDYSSEKAVNACQPEPALV